MRPSADSLSSLTDSWVPVAVTEALTVVGAAAVQIRNKLTPSASDNASVSKSAVSKSAVGRSDARRAGSSNVANGVRAMWCAPRRAQRSTITSAQKRARTQF